MTASLTHDELLALDRATWTALWDEAVRRHPDRRALQQAAELARPVAQDIIYEHLYRLAERDDLVDAEWDVLEWLDATWKSS